MEAENARLSSQLVSQEAHLAESRNQTTSLNDNLIQLECHLRRAREGTSIL